ncbi:MAG: putative RNA-binding protein YlqC (UPF0109 family) [Myxococcota bacterium]|jgi:predicted RNA-binding protein YlqC (UPF0109 family)
MEALVRHLVEPLLTEPDALQLQTVEGENVVMLEMIVAAADRDSLDADKGKTLRSVRTVLSAAAGRRKATIDLVEEFGPAEEE